jgi:hypothetical protein
LRAERTSRGHRENGEIDPFRTRSPPLHSITSSARASSAGGKVRPSVFAVPAKRDTYIGSTRREIEALWPRWTKEARYAAAIMSGCRALEAAGQLCRRDQASPALFIFGYRFASMATLSTLLMPPSVMSHAPNGSDPGLVPPMPEPGLACARASGLGYPCSALRPRNLHCATELASKPCSRDGGVHDWINSWQAELGGSARPSGRSPGCCLVGGSHRDHSSQRNRGL